MVLPQINDTLKTDIMERIASKTLTEVHVAVAPSVSFEQVKEYCQLCKNSKKNLIFSLWRKCCVAFGTQCVENDDSLAAVPYFLAVSDVDTCVSQLCDGKHFQEAWVIAKMRKEESDPIFEIILQKWISYFDYSGNYEAGAAL